MLQKKLLALAILGLMVISSMNGVCSVIKIGVVNLESGENATYMKSTIDDGVISPSILTVDGGRDIVTYVGQYTTFKGYVVSPYDAEIKYEWDFDNDGIYDSTGISYVGRTIKETFVYDISGLFKAKLKVTLLDNEKISSTDCVIVNVKTGKGEQTFINEEEPSVVKKSTVMEGDGTRTNYAVLINGDESNDAFYFLNNIYVLLTYYYDYLPENVFVLDYDGNRDPDIVDYDASLDNISYVFNLLSITVDNDDFLGVWLFDHGSGYNGPQSQYYGYLSSNSFVSVDGDEDDYLESDFKLRSLTVPQFPWWKTPPDNIGLNQWECDYYYGWGAHYCVRYQYESHFSGIYIDELGASITDNDIWIEKFTDYAAGDYDENGWIRPEDGEVYDFDGDGNPPYNPQTGEYDEGDWGNIDEFEDNITTINTGVPGNSYIIFDQNLDNHLDIDIDYDPDDLEIDGTDIDNQGLFDGLDINNDGDQNDMISIDEAVRLYNGEGLIDGFLNDLLSNIDAQVIMVVSNTCYSGGLHWDLSAPNRIIISSTIEEDYSWYKSQPLEEFTTFFADGIGIYRLGDSNNDGAVSIAEAFNYASEVDPFDEIPQYDDNGDKVSHAYLIPNGGDGELGSNTFLGVLKGPPETPTITGPTSGKPGIEYTYCASTTDPNRDNVYYWFDWGDGTNSGWVGSYASGATGSAKHRWSAQGSYQIKVKAKDIYDAESDWGTLDVTMPKNGPYPDGQSSQQSTSSPSGSSQQATASTTTTTTTTPTTTIRQSRPTLR